jgi:hypothetical protein
MKRLVINSILLIGIIIFISGSVFSQNTPSCLAGEGLIVPGSVAVDNVGNVYVSDLGTHIISKTIMDTNDLNYGGVFIYGIRLQAGFANGGIGVAQFNTPGKIFYFDDGSNTKGYLYVADTGNNAIRKIDLDSNVVSTVAPTGFSAGNPPPATTSGNFQTGTVSLSSARFKSPKGIYAIGSGVLGNPHIAVADTENHAIRLIKTDTNEVVTIAGTGNVGSVASGLEACNINQFDSPHDIFLFKSGNVYSFFVADTDNHAIQGVKYNSVTPNCEVWLLAGNGIAGYNTGESGSAVQFKLPAGILPAQHTGGGALSGGVTGNNYFWISDSGNNVIRYLKIISGNPTSAVPFAGVQGQPNYIEGSAEWYSAGNSNPPQSTSKFNTPTGMFFNPHCITTCTNPGDYHSSTEFYVVDTGNKIVRKIKPENGFSWKTTRFFARPEDVMFKLSSETNSHVERWNGAGEYSVGICHSDIYWGTPPLVNPIRTCSGGNNILRIDGNTNAHAERRENSNNAYSDVCYNGLICESVAGNVACSSGKTEVVSLSGSTNAHVETAGSNTYSTPGNYKICCSTFIAPIVTFAPVEWRDFANIKIPSPPPYSLVCKGQTVKAYAGVGTSLSVGANVEVRIFDEDSGFDDEITNLPNLNPANNNNPFTGTVEDDGSGNLFVSVPWEITEERLDAGNIGQTVLGIGEGDELEIYFKIKDPLTLVEENSYIIKATDDPSRCQDVGPTAEIIAPVHRGIYFVNNQIDFVPNCNSAIGPIQSYDWKLTQYLGTSSPTVTTNNLPAPGTFSIPANSAQAGQGFIELTCTDLNGKSAKSESMIVLEGGDSEILVFINNPSLLSNNNVVYNSPTPGSGYTPTNQETEVDYSADDSFAFVKFGCEIYCLTGDNCCIAGNNCESSGAQTVGTNPSCSSNKLNIKSTSSLNNLPGVTLSTDYTDIEFDWKFWDNNFNDDRIPQSGNTPGAVSGTAVYSTKSNALNDKHMSLRLKSIGALDATLNSYSLSPTNDFFQRDFTLGRCLQNGNKFLHPSFGLQSTTSVPNACLGVDPLETDDDCCPSGMGCFADNNNPGRSTCQFPTTLNPIEYCSDYNIENYGSASSANSACNSDPIHVASASWTSTLPDPRCEFVECEWDNSQNVCTVHVVQASNDANQGGCFENPGIPSPSCNYEIDAGACVNGRQSITYTLTTSSPSSCMDRQPITVPCGSLNFELGFFDSIQFVASALIIILIYFALGISKKNK